MGCCPSCENMQRQIDNHEKKTLAWVQHFTQQMMRLNEEINQLKRK